MNNHPASPSTLQPLALVAAGLGLAILNIVMVLPIRDALAWLP